jgi:hypothetical protein
MLIFTMGFCTINSAKTEIPTKQGGQYYEKRKPRRLAYSPKRTYGLRIVFPWPKYDLYVPLHVPDHIFADERNLSCKDSGYSGAFEGVGCG